MSIWPSGSGVGVGGVLILWGEGRLFKFNMGGVSGIVRLVVGLGGVVRGTFMGEGGSTDVDSLSDVGRILGVR